MTIKTQAKTFIKNPIQGTKYTIAISSAKGGVGKSTFATNIALDFGCCVGTNESIDCYSDFLADDQLIRLGPKYLFFRSKIRPKSHVFGHKIITKKIKIFHKKKIYFQES